MEMCLRYNMIDAYNAGEKRHPHLVIKELCAARNAKLLNAEGVSIADCWLFDVDVPSNPAWPVYVERLPS